MAAPIPRALTVAGSDSGGCAGVQADLKTFAALEVHGMSVITSVTAQDTRSVHMTTDLPVENIERQFEAVIEDIGVDAVKTGMLASADIIEAVVHKLQRYHTDTLVVDPVMISTGGDPLINRDAVEVLKRKLIPLAMIVTPNLHEAEILSGNEIGSQQELSEAIRRIHALGCAHVVVKGGHFKDPAQSTDYFFDGDEITLLGGPRFKTEHTHGSGCTFASAIAAHLAKGLDVERSVVEAKKYVSEAIRQAFPLGRGHGPLRHFWKQWEN